MIISPPYASQRGFTLIELMLAMMIFAMLALAGWQIMDSLTKSRDRGNVHLKALSALDVTYLQLSQDLSQTTNYVVMPKQGLAPSPSFVLTGEQISFVRFAAPDPRYRVAPILAKVVYRIENDKLIKQRFYHLSDTNETPATSVLLTGIKDASWAAFTPQSVTNYPDEATLQKIQQQRGKQVASPPSSQNIPPNAAHDANRPPIDSAAQKLSTVTDLLPYQQLPRGVALSFNYQGEAVTWHFALPNGSPPTVSED